MAFSNIFWSPVVWLPKGYTWENFKNPNMAGIRFPEVNDLMYAILFTPLFLLLRYTLEQFAFIPFGQRLGLANHEKKQPRPNSILEEFFQRTNGHGLSTGHELRKLCDQTQLKPRTIQRWFRNRIHVTKPSKLTKFSESMWRLCCYATTSSMGLVIMWDKPFFWDFKRCLDNFPNDNTTFEIQVYYVVSLTLYISFTVTQFSDAKRKDFWQMCLHHALTILLLTISWIVNYVNVGTVVLLLHDLGDVPLELTKVVTYTKKGTLGDACFATFVLVWILTRLGLFPYLCILTFSHILRNNSGFPVIYVIYIMLCLLFCLHIVWSYFISKMVVRAFSQKRSIERDSRSSTESSEEYHSSRSKDTKDKKQ